MLVEWVLIIIVSLREYQGDHIQPTLYTIFLTNTGKDHQQHRQKDLKKIPEVGISYCWFHGYLHRLAYSHNHNTILDGTALYFAYGWSLRLLVAVCSSLTHFFIFLDAQHEPEPNNDGPKKLIVSEVRVPTKRRETVNDASITFREERLVIPSVKRTLIDSEISSWMKNRIRRKRDVTSSVRHLRRLSHHGSILRMKFVRVCVLEYVGPYTLRTLRNVARGISKL